MSSELFGGHLFRDVGSRWGDWSGGDRASSFLLGAVTAEVPRFSAPEATPLLHQFGSFLGGHDAVGFSNDVDVHGVRVFLWAEGPSWLGLAGLRGSSVEDSL